MRVLLCEALILPRNAELHRDKAVRIGGCSLVFRIELQCGIFQLRLSETEFQRVVTRLRGSEKLQVFAEPEIHIIENRTPDPHHLLRSPETVHHVRRKIQDNRCR